MSIVIDGACRTWPCRRASWSSVRPCAPVAGHLGGQLAAVDVELGELHFSPPCPWLILRIDSSKPFSASSWRQAIARLLAADVAHHRLHLLGLLGRQARHLELEQLDLGLVLARAAAARARRLRRSPHRRSWVQLLAARGTQAASARGGDDCDDAVSAAHRQYSQAQSRTLQPADTSCSNARPEASGRSGHARRPCRALLGLKPKRRELMRA